MKKDRSLEPIIKKELFKGTGVIGVIKAQRLRRLGRIERMSETRILKMLITGTAGRWRREDRSTQRWRVEVVYYLRT